MATKKKSFDAVAESRRWRIETGRKLRGLSFEEQQALLRRTTKEELADLRDLNAAVVRNQGKPGVAWDKAKAALGL